MMTRSPSRLRHPVRMGAIPAGSPVVVVGNGPVFLLAAKTATSMGHATTIVSNQKELYNTLLWGQDEPDPRLTMLGVTSDADVTRFEDAVKSAAGVIISFDAEQALPEKLLDVVLPPSPENRRVAILSRHLNGKGMGPLVVASKAAANAEVWSGSLELYQDFEAKVAAAAAASPNTDVVTVRCGTLKGGGPGDAASVVEKGSTATLSYAFYKMGQQDLVNWKLLFDCDTNGVRLTKGDTASGPGWRAAFTATSPEAEPGDSGRSGVAQALVRALRLEGAGGKDFGVETAQARLPPTDEDWEAMLQAVIT